MTTTCPPDCTCLQWCGAQVDCCSSNNACCQPPPPPAPPAPKPGTLPPTGFYHITFNMAVVTEGIWNYEPMVITGFLQGTQSFPWGFITPDYQNPSGVDFYIDSASSKIAFSRADGSVPQPGDNLWLGMNAVGNNGMGQFTLVPQSQASVMQIDSNNQNLISGNWGYWAVLPYGDMVVPINPTKCLPLQLCDDSACYNSNPTCSRGFSEVCCSLGYPLLVKSIVPVVPTPLSPEINGIYQFLGTYYISGVANQSYLTFQNNRLQVTTNPSSYFYVIAGSAFTFNMAPVSFMGQPPPDTYNGWLIMNTDGSITLGPRTSANGAAWTIDGNGTLSTSICSVGISGADVLCATKAPNAIEFQPIYQTTINRSMLDLLNTMLTPVNPQSDDYKFCQGAEGNQVCFYNRSSANPGEAVFSGLSSNPNTILGYNSQGLNLCSVTALLVASNQAYGMTVMDQNIAEGNPVVINTSYNNWNYVLDGSIPGTVLYSIILKTNPAFGLVSGGVFENAPLAISQTTSNFLIWQFNKDGTIVLKNNTAYGIGLASGGAVGGENTFLILTAKPANFVQWTWSSSASTAAHVAIPRGYSAVSGSGNAVGGDTIYLGQPTDALKLNNLQPSVCLDSQCSCMGQSPDYCGSGANPYAPYCMCQVGACSFICGLSCPPGNFARKAGDCTLHPLQDIFVQNWQCYPDAVYGTTDSGSPPQNICVELSTANSGAAPPGAPTFSSMQSCTELWADCPVGFCRNTTLDRKGCYRVGFNRSSLSSFDNCPEKASSHNDACCQDHTPSCLFPGKSGDDANDFSWYAHTVDGTTSCHNPTHYCVDTMTTVPRYGYYCTDGGSPNSVGGKHTWVQCLESDSNSTKDNSGAWIGCSVNGWSQSIFEVDDGGYCTLDGTSPYFN